MKPTLTKENEEKVRRLEPDTPRCKLTKLNKVKTEEVARDSKKIQYPAVPTTNTIIVGHQSSLFL